ncbi:methyltransferase domain-containing protein [Microtetraspora fusca]|uniref:Methyltransferase domain-containing protein n=1 Tax=Microtetraspora fusca TaxID=1997 RepID=A0ABW6V8S6_MICFU|nr:methyltransferase domain-containing protein [Microtetraspora fusca]
MSEPDITLVRDGNGDVTLYIDDIQAMQGWERTLMWRSADLLCERGGEFLEVGLGLGYSALRIAERADTFRHTVIEKHPKVIELFRAEHPDPPATLEIVQADFFDYVDTLAPDSYDGVFFDPELPKELFEDRGLLDDFMPKIVRALRRGGTFVPMFSLDGDVPEAATCTASAAVMLDRYLRFFDRVVVERHRYRAYANTVYTPGRVGDAFVLCFTKD